MLELSKLQRKETVMKWHQRFGICAFICMLLCMYTGYKKL